MDEIKKEKAEAKGTEKADKKSEKKAVPEEKTESAPNRKLERKLEEAQTALAEEKDSYLRLLAEYDNYKKRSAKEKEDLYALAAADVLGKLLPTFDNLERATGATDFESLQKGVEMILSSFHTALTACGVAEIETEGKAFDPALHEAVLHEERDDLGENEICGVLQKGYLLGERVLRHAMVKVAN